MERSLYGCAFSYFYMEPERNVKTYQRCHCNYQVNYFSSVNNRKLQLQSNHNMEIQWTKRNLWKKMFLGFTGIMLYNERILEVKGFDLSSSLDD